ncbi:MAG: hypothetical protein P1U86_19810 [Verrucomicrobiales bacterium]|nr:hypothetical protein [Verrucomicrobiales bacterium]
MPGTHSGLVVAKSEAFREDETVLYLRLSMGDYRIRCSGSGISEEDLRDKAGDLVTLRGEILRGKVQDPGGDGDYLLVTALVD